MCQFVFQVGKALFDGQLLDVHFTRSFYKHILGVKVTYHDIEAIDPDYFKNLKWMLEVCYISKSFLRSPYSLYLFVRIIIKDNERNLTFAE